MPKRRKRPRSLPKGNIQDWENLATLIYHLERQLEQLEGREPPLWTEREVIVRPKKDR